ncbi:GNAT family N-acetyltransferase [Nisaea acidiphila]|uniref:GNAT family N-acetyltransferase n=1 Tax=Nisaea acidiphila TaxID=1862145 RepID=A0A9J7AZ46_9PROT|nr:GNAT family N-acetyltransferase [Nisaea acidiphila]UUX51705.1 GNAT family N-acetyltransferase [Nisaea acidiphila]
MSGPLIRPATSGDIPRIAEIFGASRLIAYRGLVPDADILASSDPDRPKWRELLEAENQDFLVAELDGTVQAMAVLEIPKLHSLHVHPDAQGSGIGRALLAYCREKSSPAGMELYCLLGNDRAAAFYEKAGMRRTGTVEQDIYGKIYPAARYAFDG